MTTEILPVTSAKKIARTAALARSIWQEHYTPIIGSDQVEYMLAAFQSETAIAEQITEGTDYFLMRFDGNDAGYFALICSADTVMLSKLYVAPAFRRRGIAAEALHFADRYCRARDISTLWLTVNKNNTAAIAAYQSMGFVNAGPVVQEIGGGFVMDDYRLERAVPSVSS